MDEWRKKCRKNQNAKKISLISERPAPFYPEDVKPRDFYDEILIRRHTPHGVEEIRIESFMSPKRIDCFNVSKDGYMEMKNNRPVQMGSYKLGEYIAKILGRRGRFNE